MGQPGFEISYDASARILHLRLWGFWSVATLAAYTARLLTEVTRRRGDAFDIISHAQDFEVQGKVVSVGFEYIARRGAEMHKGRTAVIVGSQLNRLQAQRTLSAANVGVFLDEAAAMRWIEEGRHHGQA